MTTIAEKLTTIKNALKAIKNSIIAKGQTPTGDITTYATAIDNIKSGGGSSSDFVGIPREVNSGGVYGYPTENFTFSLPSNVTDVGDNVLYGVFMSCESLTSVDLSNLQIISGYQAMCLTFNGCSNLTSVDLSNLQIISGSRAMLLAFGFCPNLASISFPSLTTISGSHALMEAFEGSDSIELSFPALTSSSFGSYTDQFHIMLNWTPSCTVHFPSNLESVIGSWSDVTSGFGGSNTTVLFDLPATE